MELQKQIVLATDHGGYELKEILKQYLSEEKGIDVIDVGTFSTESIDYPAIIRKGCGVVLEYGCLGIVLGGSGNGEAMAANKVRGIRCALVYSDDTARLAREHNNANVMSLGGRLSKPDDAKRFVDIFLSTEFEGGRHQRRIDDLDAEY